MTNSVIGSAATSAAIAAAGVVPIDGASLQSLGWSLLAAVLGTVLSWLSGKLK